jgi:hypothetical protein
MTDLTRKQIAAHDHTPNNGEGFPLTNLKSTGIIEGKVPVSNGTGGIVWDNNGGGAELDKIIVIPGPNNNTASGIATYPATHLGFLDAIAQTEAATGEFNYVGDTIVLPVCYIKEADEFGFGTYPTYTIKPGTLVIGQGIDSTRILGQLNLENSAKLKDIYIDGRSNATQSWAINGNNNYQYLFNIYVHAEPFDGSALQPVALYNCSFAYSENCYYRALTIDGVTFLPAFGSSLTAGQQITYPIGGFSRGSVIVGNGLGIEKVRKDYSNYSSWDVFGTGNFGDDSFHANDIASETLKRHLPLPTPTGMIPVSNGTSWGLTALPTGGTGSGGGYTLIADATVSVDGSVIFTDIPQTYKQLHIVGRVRGSNNGTSDTLTIQVGNGSIDTGVNYSYMLRQDGSAAANNRSDTAIYIAGGIISGNSDTAGYFSDIRVDINYYTDSQFKTFEVQSSTYGAAYRSSIGGGIWKSTAAINQIQIQGLALGKLETGSRISLYGL